MWRYMNPASRTQSRGCQKATNRRTSPPNTLEADTVARTSDEWLIASVGGLLQELRHGALCRQGQGSQRVHNHVHPQQLQHVQGRHTARNGAHNGRNLCSKDVGMHVRVVSLLEVSATRQSIGTAMCMLLNAALSHMQGAVLGGCRTHHGHRVD